MSNDIIVPKKDQQEESELEVQFKGKVDEVTKMATATAMALSTGYCMERRFLTDFHDKNSIFSLYKRIDGKNSLDNIYWLKIDLVGKSETDNLDACFSALKNILRSCSIPKTKLLFLITGKNRKFNIYIGIAYKPDHNVDDATNAIHEVDSFINISWPGIKTHVLDSQDAGITSFTENVYNKAYAFTGIPSMDLDKTRYPSTLEYLLGGCKPEGEIAYLVVAEPIDEIEINSMIYQCEEISGQAESFKSFTVSHSLQKGYSDSITKTVSETIGHTETEGTSERDVKSALLGLLGVGVAAGAVIAFPPLAAMAAGAGSAVAALVGSEAVAAQLLGGAGLAGAGILSSFIPQKSKSISDSNQKTTSLAETHGITSSYTTTLGGTLVNGHMSAIAEQLKIYINRIQEGKARGMWQVGCYLFTDSENFTSHIQLKSILSGEASRIEPIRIHDISKYSTNGNKKKVTPFTTPPELYIEKKNDSDHNEFKHPLGRRNSCLTTLVTTSELTSFINFPLHSVPGVSVLDRDPEFRLDVPTIENKKHPVGLGCLMYHGGKTDMQLSTSMDGFARHTLICGANGSGKTNTVLGILSEVSRYDNGNFMVIEPAKTEYVDWAIKYNDTLYNAQSNGLRLDEKPIIIYMPGKNSYWHADEDGNSVEYILSDILKLNPFEPVALDGKTPNVVSHLDRIKSIFALAFPMEDILPTVMESLLRDVYTNGEKWLKRGKNDPIPENFPTLGLLACRIRSVISSLGYEPRVTANIYAAINLRLSNLLSGWKRELLNNEVLGGYKKLSKKEQVEGVQRPTWDDFFKRKVVVNLSGVADENDRTFVMGLLLLYLYEYRIARSERRGFNFNSNKLEHLTIVEEAHRVMMNNPNPDSPQYKCGLLFSNLLSEIRAYHEGIMIVDQVPSRLIPDAVKNTNLKIIHRLISHDDIELVSKSMGISEEQQKIIPKLGIGQAVVAGIHTGKDSDNSTENIYWCKINKTKSN